MTESQQGTHGTEKVYDEPLFKPEPHTTGVDISTKRQPPKNLPDAMIKGLRPKQWVKNVLVLAAPLAAGNFTGRTLIDVALAFIVFCLGASSIYLVNDALDVDSDREHPTKRFRPIASGMLPIKLAFGMAIALIVAAIGLSSRPTARRSPWSLASTSPCSWDIASAGSTSR